MKLRENCGPFIIRHPGVPLKVPEISNSEMRRIENEFEMSFWHPNKASSRLDSVGKNVTMHSPSRLRVSQTLKINGCKVKFFKFSSKVFWI